MTQLLLADVSKISFPLTTILVMGVLEILKYLHKILLVYFLRFELNQLELTKNNSPEVVPNKL